MSDQDRIVELLEELHDKSVGFLKKDIFKTLEEVYGLEYYDFEDEDIFNFYTEKVVRYNAIVNAEMRTWKNLCGEEAEWPPNGVAPVVMKEPHTVKLEGPIHKYVTFLPGTLEQFEDYYNQLADEIFDEVGSYLIRYKPGRKFGVVEGGKP